MANPSAGQHVPARAVARGRWRTGVQSAWSPSPACTTDCTSPTCGPEAGGGPHRPGITRQAGARPAGRTATAAGRPDIQRVRHRRLGRGQAQGRGGARAADGRAVHGRGGAPDLGRGGHRLVPGDLGRCRGVGPALPAPGAGRGGAAPGAAGILRRPASGAGQEGARGIARGFLRAGDRQRLGVRPAGGKRVRAGRRRRARARGGGPRAQDQSGVSANWPPERRGSRRSASPTGFPS